MNVVRYFIKREKENKAATAAQCLYAAACIASFAYFLITDGSANNVTVSLSYILILFVPYVGEYIFRGRCPQWFVVLAYANAFLAFLGEAYNLYFLFPPLDVILHFSNGAVMGMIGFALVGNFIDWRASRGGLLACAAFAVACGITVSALWEFYEFFRSMLTGMDHEEDVVVYSIRSFALSGTHDKPLVLDNITKTLIYYNGGADVYELSGYLDIGLSDTITDMLSGALGSLLVLPLSLIKKGGARLFPEKVFPMTEKRREAGRDAGNSRAVDEC
ncbi:MAG: hypothetical protein J5940_02065 [Clostridia bacterium]|nr:hypothetical protein [Clostridia bacterium]